MYQVDETPPRDYQLDFDFIRFFMISNIIKSLKALAIYFYVSVSHIWPSKLHYIYVRITLKLLCTRDPRIARI